MTDPQQPIPGNRLAGLARYDEDNLPPASDSGNPPYDDPITRQKAKQERRWSALIFEIRYWLVIAAAVVAIAVLLGLLALVVWLVYLFVIHYTTAPSRHWLEPTALGQLGAIYGNFAKFAAPTALIANAWLVAYFGTRRWASRHRD